MSSVRTETAALVEGRPEYEPLLAELLAVDEATDGWSFEDVPLDSGQFGEVVARGLVVEGDEGYRLADPEAVRAALDGVDAAAGDPPAPDEDAAEVTVTARLRETLVVDLDRTTGLALVGALALFAAVRSLSAPNVFADGEVFLFPNDPYYYWFLVDQVAGQTSGPFDPSVFQAVPSAVERGEPLLVVALWFVVEAVGGRSGGVLAWYPVVAGLVVAFLVYHTGNRLTADRRVGVAAVVMAAVSPLFVFRTSLGFADHHAFDYVWLALTAAALVSLAVRHEGSEDDPPWRDRSTVLPTVGLTIGVSGQTLAWEAGPLLLVPLGVFVAFRAVSDLRADVSPLRASAPVLVGVTAGAVLVGVVHVSLGWHAAVVALAPALLAAGVAVVLVAAEAAHRTDRSARTVAVAGVVVALGVLAVVLFSPSVLPAELSSGIERLVEPDGIAEKYSLFAGQFGVVVTPLTQFGLVFFFALPYLVLATRSVYRRHAPALLVLVVYSWYFMSLAGLSRRFGGQLAVFTAVFAALGFLRVAAWVDAAAPVRGLPGRSTDGIENENWNGNRDGDEGRTVDDGGRPSPRPVAWPGRDGALAVTVLLVLVCGLGVIYGTSILGNLTYTDAERDLARTAEGYATDRGLDYPENYVLSRMGQNRMYNHVVNGESRSYRFAQRSYIRTLRGTTPAAAYGQYADRVGFVVVDTDRLGARNASGSNTLYAAVAPV
jgi:dolichyl-diphosphooligosaccharide--protein glycosyltransferase